MSPDSNRRSPRGLGRLLIYVIGCAAAWFVFVTLIVGVTTSLSLKGARKANLALEKRFGPQSSYVPPADGQFPEARLAAFLAVRKSLVASCIDLTDIPRDLGGVFAHARSPEEPLRSRLSGTQHALERYVNQTWFAGNYLRTRDQTLWMRRMSLGEYSYIYVVAYGSLIATNTCPESAFSGPPLNPRTRALMITMMEEQLNRAEADIGQVPGDFLAPLEAELEALQTDPGRIPWQNSLPDPLRRSIEPFRAELDACYCAAATALELRHHPGTLKNPLGE